MSLLRLKQDLLFVFVAYSRGCFIAVVWAYEIASDIVEDASDFLGQFIWSPTLGIRQKQPRNGSF